MLVAPSQFEELYDGALREDLASSEDKKLLVFVSTGEADSVCATRILQVRATPQCLCSPGQSAPAARRASTTAIDAFQGAAGLAGRHDIPLAWSRCCTTAMR